MNKTIDIKIERTFGEILGDGMKLVFRHLKEMGMMLLVYAMPFIAVALIIVILNGSINSLLSPEGMMSDESIMSLFSLYLILGIGLGIGIILMNLIVYSTIITFHEYDGEVSADNISMHVKSHMGNYLLSILTEGVILFGMFFVVGLFAAISPVLFGILYFIMIYVACWIFNIIQFLGIVRVEEKLTVSQGLKRCFFLLKNNWWETFALILVTSLLGSILMYGIVIIFMVLFGVLAGFYIDNQTMDSSTILSILSGIFMLVYILVMSASNMYLAGVRILKYYDLVEKKEANNLLTAIEQIGQVRNDLFENEGEF